MGLRWYILQALAAGLALSVAPARAAIQDVQVPIIGQCEGCEAVFDGLPDSPSSRSRLAPPDEPGEPMVLRGRVVDREGVPVAGVIVYAYHTDARGVYPEVSNGPRRAAARHGRLRGWAMTDEDGWYRFDTIRPGSYPSGRIPAHVHMHVIEPGCCTYYIDTIHFTDDPLLSGEVHRGAEGARGGSGRVTPERGEDGVWVVVRDIVLGKNVPGHAEASGAAAQGMR